MATQRPSKSSSSSSSSSTNQAFIIRPARLSDVPLLAIYGRTAYAGTVIMAFLSPHVDKYPEDLDRRFRYQIQKRMASPRNVTVVACEASAPDVPLAYGQFSRVGKDEGAQSFIRSRGVFTRVLLWLWRWWLYVVFTVGFRLWPDRSSDEDHLREFGEWASKDSKTYFDVEGRRERWHAQILTVSPEWQGKGLGRKIMSVVMELARKEGVPVGLFASPVGERLYRKLGFEMLGDFCQRPEGDEGGGGLMIWNPKDGVN
ncbi:hypothetical protein B7463_g4433, partial [Scytalidium lignicola]